MDKKSPRHEGIKRFWGHKFFHAISKFSSNFQFGKFEKHILKKEDLPRKKPKTN